MAKKYCTMISRQESPLLCCICPQLYYTTPTHSGAYREGWDVKVRHLSLHNFKGLLNRSLDSKPLLRRLLLLYFDSLSMLYAIWYKHCVSNQKYCK